MKAIGGESESDTGHPFVQATKESQLKDLNNFKSTLNPALSEKQKHQRKLANMAKKGM